jgi:hypothetical protein
MKLDERVVTWLALKGIEVEFTDQEHPDSFVPGVWLDRGKLIVNHERAHVGDVLHEAGHLACIPSKFRELTEPGSLMTPKLEAAVKEYCDTHPFMDAEMQEDPVWRAIMQMGDCEATAWAYAASKYLELSPEILFSEREYGEMPYDGEGPDIWKSLDMNSYFGINGLQAGGFCSVRTFPQMTRWLAP